MKMKVYINSGCEALSQMKITHKQTLFKTTNSEIICEYVQKKDI